MQLVAFDLEAAVMAADDVDERLSREWEGFLQRQAERRLEAWAAEVAAKRMRQEPPETWRWATWMA